MATFTLPANPRFAVASTVYVYAETAFAESGGPFSAPAASAVVAADGAATFTGLAGGTRYWAAQQQSGVWVRIAFTTDRAGRVGNTFVGAGDPDGPAAGDLWVIDNEDGTVTIKVYE